MIHPLLILFLYYMVAHQAVPVYTKEPTLFVILNQDAFTYLGAWSQIAGCRDDNLNEFHWLLIFCKMLHRISSIAIYLIRENIRFLWSDGERLMRVCAISWQFELRIALLIFCRTPYQLTLNTSQIHLNIPRNSIAKCAFLYLEWQRNDQILVSCDFHYFNCNKYT